MKSTGILHIPHKELFVQVILYLVVFLFYSFDKNNPEIQLYQVVFFLNYTLASLGISYYLLSKFLYKEHYLAFFLSFMVVTGLVIVVEELVLEKIYFPDTRGKGFPGLVYTLLEVLPVLLILAGFKVAWDVLKKQREVNELKATIEESELQFLKSQINPHFLFNNLNNLYSYAISNSPKTPEIILELSAVLRYMLYECKEDFVPLHKEIEQLENFTRLNELQIEERGSVNIHTSTIYPGFKIAPLILIVFIENAFKHSQSGQSEKIFINILIQMQEDGRLDFYCENNFRPSSSTENLSKGIGLENVKKRLNLLYPNMHHLSIVETNNHYDVHATLQLTQNQESHELYYH